MDLRCTSHTTPSEMIDTMASSSALDLAFGSGAQTMQEKQARTWYICADDAATMQSWLNAIDTNIRAATVGVV